MDDYIVVLVTASSMEEVERIALQLIGSGLAPCVNIISSCRSIYQWKQEIHKDDEVLMIIKSRRALFSELVAIIEKNHSYDVPEIISLPLVEASRKYSTYLKGFLRTD
ncbi:MAG: divalent-cation tolerance protein CutA [bacterium]|nr:MAG: divalent-cation tolerance protein CutA [bacterium]